MPIITDNGRTVTLNDGDDSYAVPQDNAIVNLIYGLGGNDRITGGIAGGTIYGGAGNDVLMGAANSATTLLVGGLGANSYFNGVAVLNGNARDYTYYGETDGIHLFANNGSGDQILGSGVSSVVFQDGTTVSDVSQLVALATNVNYVQFAPVKGDANFSGSFGTQDRLVLNGNVQDYALTRDNGFDGYAIGPSTGLFALHATNGSGTINIAETIDIVQFANGQYLALHDVPAYVTGDAGIGFAGNQDDLLYQTHLSGYQFFSGGAGADTLYLNGNEADYISRAMTAISASTVTHRGYADYYLGNDIYSGVALTGTNGSGELLIDNSTETVVFKNGQHVQVSDLLSTLMPDTTGNADVLHFVPTQEPTYTEGGLVFDGSDSALDRLLLNGNVSDYVLSRGSRGEFVLTPHGLTGTDALVDTIGQTIDTVQFANGQYLAPHDLPAYIAGDATFTSGTLGDDTLIVPNSGDQYVTGLDGSDTLYIHGNTHDYTLHPIDLAATAEHPAVNGYELVGDNGSGNLYIDQSIESIHFQNGQYLAFGDLHAYIAS